MIGAECGHCGCEIIGEILAHDCHSAITREAGVSAALEDFREQEGI